MITGVLGWLLVLKFLQLASWPVLRGAFGRIAYGLAYPGGFLAYTLLSWYLGLAVLPVQAALLPFAASVLYFWYRGFYTLENFRKEAWWDVLFLLAFLFMLEVRFFNPGITYAEKFMDHAFIASVMRMPVVVPLDPWYAGGVLDVYYYLGHWSMGVTGIAAGAPSTLVFNLVLPTVFAFSAVGLCACGRLLVPRYAALPVLALLLPNPSFFAHAFALEPFTTIMWESTRTIPDTINEYPLFSFLWGDPHAHVIAIFVQVFLIAVLIAAISCWKQASVRDQAVIVCCAALGLGSMPGVNSWDVLVFAPFVVLAGLIIWWQGRHEKGSWSFLVAVPPLAVLAYLPYYLQLNTQGIEGIGIVASPSPVPGFLAVYGFFIAIFWAFCLSDLKKRPWLLVVAVPFIAAGYWAAAVAAVPLACLLARRRFAPIELPAIAGLAVITATELLFLVDNMGDLYFRMNTVFKFGLVAWTLMGVSAFAMIGRWLGERKIALTIPGGHRTAMVLLALLLVTAPVLIPDITYGYGGKTLDGLAYLETSHPGDAAAVAWLRTVQAPVTLVEAEGGDYTYYSRVSSFTGIPALIGMPFHEQMWRGDDAGASERSNVVRRIYEVPEETVPLMEEYGIDLLYLGESERERYDVSLPDTGLGVIYDEEGVTIACRNSSSACSLFS
jgi:YYY domain-containing protein